GNLANGGKVSLTIQALVNAGTKNTALVNTAQVSGSSLNDPTPGNNSSSATIYVGGADLSVSKMVSNSNPDEGDIVIYTVIVQNNGSNEATNITVTDLLPTSQVLYLSDDSGGAYTPGTGIWVVGNLPTGNNATLLITVQIQSNTASTTIVNTGSVESVDQLDPNSGNNSGSVSLTVKSPDLAMTKSVDNSTPNETDKIRYTITVNNIGTGNATGIIITDDLPGGLTYESHETNQGTFTSASDNWIVGTLPSGTNATLILTATVDLGTAGQSIINTASVTTVDQTESDTSNNSAAASITVATADLAVTKSVNNNLPNELDTVSYTVTILNNGPQNATNVFLQDVLSGDLTHVSNIASQGSYDHTSGEWIVGNIANSSNATLTINAQINAGTAGSTIINTAVITSLDQADLDNSNDSAAVSLTVASADLAITKTVNRTTPGEGETITYSVTVLNNGPYTATNVVITDTLPAGVTFQSATAQQGSYNSGNGLWSVGTLPIGGSSILSLNATVNGGTLGTTIINTATLKSVDQTDTVSGNNTDNASITVTHADLAVVKTATTNAANEQEVVTYAITVINNGPSNATNVVISDPLPSGLTLQSITPTQGSYDSGTGLWSVGSLTNGSSATLTLAAQVNLGTRGQTIVNTAQKSSSDQGDTTTSNDSATASFSVNAPDLIVDSITANSSGVTVVVKNLGPAPVIDAFWIDAYINPSSTPTQNQIWPNIASHGLVWGIDGSSGVLPLGVNQTLTLTKDGAHYYASLSSFPASLPAGSSVWAQVDSINLSTSYGNVQESHEIFGGAYNNTNSTLSARPAPIITQQPSPSTSKPAIDTALPQRE
ncbi:MAG: DUF11 domain-containing protein, partial [Chloroflexota bacterium]